MRLGGDEFIIVLEEQKREKVSAYMQDLAQHIENYNNKGKKQYKFSFSYGVVCYTNAYESFRKFLEHADQLMYEHKKMRKSKL
jgi:diguanylate cyclase (GGDEF)-like protein